MKNRFFVTTFLVLTGSAAMAQTGPCNAQTFPSLNSAPWLGQEMLGQAAATSININVAFTQDMQVAIQCGTTSGSMSLAHYYRAIANLALGNGRELEESI